MDKFQQTRQVIIHSLKYIKGKTLDVGGRAKYKSIIAPACDEYIALDIMPGEKIDLVSDIYQIPLEDNSIDTIICIEVLEHTERPWLVVKEIKRLLKPNGICLVTAPFVFPYHPRPGDFFRYTKEGLVSLFQSEGFQIIEADDYVGFFSTIKEFIKMYFFNPDRNQHRGRIGNKIFNIIERTAEFLDKFIHSNITYANSYLIAKKI